MPNPILDCVQMMASAGWHPCTISALANDGGDWRAEIEVQDNVPQGWAWAEIGGKGQLAYHITAPPAGPLAEHPGVSVEHWVNRPAAYSFVLPQVSREVCETWIAEVAREGSAPDWAWIGTHRCITKPIEWLHEPMRSQLLKKWASK